MTENLLDGAPKAGAFVQSHLQGVFDYIATVDTAELQRLLTKEYSKEQFKLSYPFLKSVEQIDADGDKAKFWMAEHDLHGHRVRVSSQWTNKHRPFFLTYLVERDIPVNGISPELCEEWLAVAEQAGTTSKSPGGAKYKGCPIGVAQNAFVRYLLSNLGQESFTEKDWKAVKASFGDACVYCGRHDTLEMDHAIPLSRLQLGEHRLGNLVPACKACNGKKSHLRFGPFLAAKYGREPSNVNSRITAVESHMARQEYRPLGDRPDISDLLEEAREEIAAVAGKYVHLVNQAIDHGPADPGHQRPKIRG